MYTCIICIHVLCELHKGINYEHYHCIIHRAYSSASSIRFPHKMERALWQDSAHLVFLLYNIKTIKRSTRTYCNNTSELFAYYHVLYENTQTHFRILAATRRRIIAAGLFRVWFFVRISRNIILSRINRLTVYSHRHGLHTYDTKPQRWTIYLSFSV